MIWSVLDDDKDGFITAAELEDWFRDEAFLDNRLFSPHHNGVTSIHALALSFLHSVDRDKDSKVSYDDLKAYTEGMKEEEIEDLAQSLVEVNEEKKKKACKKVFTAIDYNNQSATDTQPLNTAQPLPHYKGAPYHQPQPSLSSPLTPSLSRSLSVCVTCVGVSSGYWTQEDAERFIRNEVQYQVSGEERTQPLPHPPSMQRFLSAMIPISDLLLRCSSSVMVSLCS